MTLSITVIIILITVVMHFVTESNVELKSKMLFNAYDIKHRNQWYRWITHAFIHADFSHLAINMFVLWMFGQTVENYLLSNTESGVLFYLVLYIGAVLISSTRSYFKHQDNPGYNALGASGATSAMLFAYILLRPMSMFYGIIPAFLFGVLYLWYEHSQSKKGRTGIAHDAHFWGAVFGFVGLLAVDFSLFSRFIDKINYFIQGLGV